VTEGDKYVCAFRGRRDGYQVPLALAEGGMLDQFITDAYTGPLLRSIQWALPEHFREKTKLRCAPNLPSNLVKCLWGTTLLERTRDRLGVLPSQAFDRQYSLAAASRARKAQSHLLLYSPYAWEAFTMQYRHMPRKILFQYHPHPQFERRILLEDRRKFEFILGSSEGRGNTNSLDEEVRRNAESWRHAELILCASQFTRDSLLDAGADEHRCRVIPYGVQLPDEQNCVSVNNFEALFVGTGTQRKGLHHLLLAWGKAKLPAGSRLTLVCRTIDPHIERLAMSTSRVHIVRQLSQSELTDIYGRSSLFVMPSLVEGFGLVYLEALAHGCPVLGTANTGLPDADDAGGAIRLVQPGQIDELISELETLSCTLPEDRSVRRQARVCAARSSWQLFRTRVRSSLN
jgi:glycosyltransferase involved in cell wall biosynthesis